MVGRYLLAIAAGIVGAGIVHILVIFAMPELARNNAWGRFSNLAGLNDPVRVSALSSDGPEAIGASPENDREAFAFVDPAFLTASCRFNLSAGAVRISARGSGVPFWSASVYTRQGDNIYSINDRLAIEGAFDLLVGHRDQLVDVLSSIVESESPVVPVELASNDGYITLRALVDLESRRPDVERFIQSFACETLENVDAPESAELRLE